MVDNKISIDALADAQQSLKNAIAIKSGQTKLTTALGLLQQFPERDSSKKIVKLQADTQSCFTAMKTNIDATEAAKAVIVKSIQSGVGTAQMALSKCQTANKNLNSPSLQLQDIDKAIAPTAEAKQLRETVEKSAALNDAKRYATWAVSQELMDTLNKAQQCESGIAANYDRAKVRITQALADKQRRDKEAAEKARVEKIAQEKRLKAEAEAKRKADEAARLAAEKAAAEKARADDAAKKEADRIAKEKAAAEELARLEAEKERKKAQSEAAAKERAERSDKGGGIGNYRKSRLELLQEQRGQ